MPIPGVAHRERTLPFDVLFGWRVIRVTADYLVQAGDGLVLVDATNQNVRIELPAASTLARGVRVKKIDSSVNTVTIVPAGAEKADGAAGTFLMTNPLESLALVPELSFGWWGVAFT